MTASWLRCRLESDPFGFRHRGACQLEEACCGGRAAGGPGDRRWRARAGVSRPPENRNRKRRFKSRTRDPVETAGDGDVGVAQERSGRRRVQPARRPWSPAEEPRARASPGTGWLRRSQEGEWDFFQPRKPSPPPWDFGSHPRGRDRWPAPLRGSISGPAVHVAHHTAAASVLP